MPGHSYGHRQLRIGQLGWDRAATSRRRIQRIPADDREVPSPQTRKIVEAFPLDPAADLRTFPRPAPLRISDHPPSRSPTVAPLLSFAATRCGDQVFLWRRSMRPIFCSLVAKRSQPQLSPRLLEKATKALLTRAALIRGNAAWVMKRLKRCLLSDVPAAKSECSPRASCQSPGNWMTSATYARSAAPRRSAR